MKHSTKRPTKAEAERMRSLKELGCIACMSHRHTGRLCAVCGFEVHHLLSGNRRRGHAFTIPLCRWHHRGDHGYWAASDAERLLGPSLARTSKKFHIEYGSDDELLAMTNNLLENFNVATVI